MSASEFEHLQLEVRPPMGLLRLDRPESLNSMTLGMKRRIPHAIQQLSGREEVRVIVVTGSGDKAFSSGSYVPDMLDLTPREARDYIRTERTTYDAIRRCPQPVIAAINGYALGGGCVLAVACDLQLAVNDTKIGLTELKMGVPVPLEVAILPRMIGISRTRELIYTAEPINTERARDIGLINRVYPREEFWDGVESMVDKIARHDPFALALQKDMMNKWMETDLETAIEYTINTFSLMFSTDTPNRSIREFLDSS